MAEAARLVPMHGEPRHLRAQAQFARSCDIEDVLIPRDGHLARLCPGPAQIVDEAYAGRLHVDGRLIVPAEEGPAKQRRKLSFVGRGVRDRGAQFQTGTGRRYPTGDRWHPGGPRRRVCCDAAEQAFASMPKPRRKDDEQVAEPSAPPSAAPPIGLGQEAGDQGDGGQGIGADAVPTPKALTRL